MNKYILVIILLCCYPTKYSQGEFDPNAVTHTTKAELMKYIAAGDQEILVYFYTKFDECPECKEKMPHFQEAAGYLENLEDGKVKSYKLAVKFPEYGVNEFPQLIFFMGSTPFRYGRTEEFSPENIVDWVEEAKQTPLPELTDETFEHLTQASTGATTGDWLIMFANGKRPECLKPTLPDFAHAAARLRRRKNVATFDISANPVTTKRFDIDEKTSCVEILFFHRTDLYRYKNDDRSSAALIKYVLEDYTKDEAKTVPPPHDHKNAQIEDMISGLKDMFEQHVHLGKLSFVSGLSLGLMTVFAAIIFILRRYRKKKLL